MAATDNDKGWIDRSLHGDQEAFEALVAKYQHMIHALTFRMTGSRADAEDLAQETFIQAHQRLASYRAEARFSSWLYQIALNHCLNWKNRNHRRERLQENWRQETEASPTPDDALALEVQDALMRLHPKQRAAVALTLYDGLNHAEAARILGCSETTVSWRLFTARAKLKRLLRKVPRTGGRS